MPISMRTSAVRAAGAVADVFLHQPRLARAPITLYRLGLGRLLGPRLLLLEHRGRSSGLVRQVCLEVLERPAPGTFRVISGLGPRSQWYRNLLADPRCRVSTGQLRQAIATAYPLAQEDVPAVLDRYIRQNPTGWQVLEQAMHGHLPDGLTYGEFLPVVDLVCQPAVAPATREDH